MYVQDRLWQLSLWPESTEITAALYGALLLCYLHISPLFHMHSPTYDQLTPTVSTALHFLWSHVVHGSGEECGLCRASVERFLSFLKGKKMDKKKKSLVIPSALCQQCVIFCPQVLPTGECHPGGAQRHHCHTIQSHVWEDRGGESGECQQGTVHHSGMCGQCGGRAGLHALLHQRWVEISHACKI